MESKDRNRLRRELQPRKTKQN